MYAFAAEQHGGGVTSHPDLAVNDDLSTFKFVEMVAQLWQRDVDGAGDGTGVELGSLAHVDEHPSVGRELVPLHGVGEAVHEVLGDVAEHVDRVLGAAERGRVGERDVSQLVGPQPSVHSGGEDVDALVSAFAAHGLCAIDPAGDGIEQQLDVDGLGTRVVAGMRGRVCVHDHRVDALGAQLALAEPGRRHCQVEHLGDGGGRVTSESDRVAHDVISDQAALPVGTPGQGHEGSVAERVGHEGSVTDGVDVGVVGLQGFAHEDTAALVDVETGGSGEAVFGADPDGQHDEVGGHHTSVSERDGGIGDGSDTGAEVHRDVMAA